MSNEVESSTDEERSDEPGPWLVAQDLQLVDWTGPLSAQISQPSLYCEKASASLVRSLVEPGRVKAGRVLLGGRTVSECLADGTAGYCPRVLPAAGTVTVRQALLASARLIALSASAVDDALSACGLRALSRTKMDRLELRELRLVGIAHGLTSQPKYLLIEDLLSDLDDASAHQVSALLKTAVKGRKFVMAGQALSEVSRLWRIRAGAVISTRDGLPAGPLSADQVECTSHWVATWDDPTGLLEALDGAGISVARTPKPNSLLVNASAATIFEHAAACRTKITSLTPFDAGELTLPHARSGS